MLGYKGFESGNGGINEFWIERLMRNFVGKSQFYQNGAKRKNLYY